MFNWQPIFQRRHSICPCATFFRFARKPPPYALGRRYVVGSASPIRSRSKNKYPKIRPQVFPIMQTLDPSRLQSSDFMDISFRSRPKILREPISEHPQCYLIYQEFSEKEEALLTPKQEKNLIPFPPRTRGFLYYYTPPNKVPPAAGGLRFRLTQDSDPESFFRGGDLRYPNGLTWHLPLLAIAHEKEYWVKKSFQPIRRLLIEGGLVTQSLLAKCATMNTAMRGKLNSQSYIIHSLGQLFPVNFDESSISFYMLAGDNIQQIILRDMPSYATIIAARGSAPYGGSALCCFERSPLPEHDGTRTIVLRINKILKPVTVNIPNYNGPVQKPTEGGLIYRGQVPWWCDVDKTAYTTLKSLFRSS